MYVVTGATGNTGSGVAKRLLATGQKVRVIGRSAERLQALAAEGAEPFVADLADQEALNKAFTGAKAVYLMIPPPMASEDPRGFQARISDAFAAALEKTGVKNAVALSSVGADKPDKTGPVVGLHELEQTLNRIAGLNVLHLRAGYFMENTLAQIGVIPSQGFAAGPLYPELEVPMIATRDIGSAAAEALLKLDFAEHQTREMLGQRAISYTQATEIIGKGIGIPNLRYHRVPDDQLRPILVQMGMSSQMANLLLEMSAALNSGYMRALELRSAQNTTPTSFETFVAEEFVPRYRQRPAKAA